MTQTASLFQELEARAGAASIRSRTELGRWNVVGVEPLAVVQPEDAAGVAAVLAFCSEAGVPVEPAGAGTWLRAGRPPAAPPVVLSTARLRRVVEYEPADLVVGVEAGMPLHGLEAELAVNRQVLPLDPPAAAGATVGATIALGAAGPLRALHRTPRDLLLGVELVTGDGRVLRFGGRVVKNVAGYDIVRLVAGSRGVLGVLTSAFLLLRSAPAVSRTFAATAADAGEAADLALEIRDRVAPEALEVVSAEGARLPAGVTTGGGWAVLARLRGSSAAVDEEVSRLRALAGRSVEVDDENALWRRLSQDEAAAETYLRFGDRPARLAATLQQALEVAPPPAWRIAAHGADGIVRAWQPPGAAVPPAEPFADAVGAAAGLLAEGGGTLHAPVLPTTLRAAIELPGAREARVLGLMAALRRTFDPAGILSQGRHGF